MRILVLSNEVWNDKINGNNVTSNWFEGMNAEFANIYCSPETPFNKCCQRYFQITDTMMLKSIIKKEKAGIQLPIQNYQYENLENIAELEPKKLYGFLKLISGPFLRFIREELWLIGKYDLDKMRKFIDDFKPDVIFSERMASCKMLRLEKIVSQMTNASMYAFTGDDEYTLKQISFSPFFWINRFMVRKRLRQNVKRYKIYYTLSEEQGKYYEHIFGCRCKQLYKCGQFKKSYKNHIVNKPIRMIYAGKLYCNRWKMLCDIVSVIKKINKDSVKIILEIYTKDKVIGRKKKLLNDGRNVFIKGAVNQHQLSEEYAQSDIALHVESLDLKNRLLTKYSFSTKIIDCLFSGCAVMAYCWEKHSGLIYLKKRDAAICVSSPKDLNIILNKFVSDSSIIQKYSQNAYICGEKFHDRKIVQEMLLRDMHGND